MMGGMGAGWRARRAPLRGSVREGGAPPVRGAGYTGILELVAIAASPAVGSGGARRCERLAFSIALHPVVTGCALHTTFGGRWLLPPGAV